MADWLKELWAAFLDYLNGTRWQYTAALWFTTTANLAFCSFLGLIALTGLLMWPTLVLERRFLAPRRAAKGRSLRPGSPYARLLHLYTAWETELRAHPGTWHTQPWGCLGLLFTYCVRVSWTRRPTLLECWAGGFDPLAFCAWVYAHAAVLGWALWVTLFVATFVHCGRRYGFGLAVRVYTASLLAELTIAALTVLAYFWLTALFLRPGPRLFGPGEGYTPLLAGCYVALCAAARPKLSRLELDSLTTRLRELSFGQLLVFFFREQAHLFIFACLLFLCLFEGFSPWG